MLQINSGKLYPDGVQATNRLRGVLYSNLHFASLCDVRVDTAAGSILETDARGQPGALVYELTEQMDQAKGVGVLASHGVQPYLLDFSYVLSFVLNITCSPDHDTAVRLLSDRHGLSLHTSPSKLVSRVFDKQVWLQADDQTRLITFVSDIIGLKRKTFLAVMRAIRTYVTGLHRISDDAQIAYSLLVASIESLAQTFDNFEGTWSDLEEGKRKRIDKALKNAPPETMDAVRAAIIEIEHLSLARRFREFAMDHLTPEFYNEPGRVGALGVSDMRDAFREAYRLRSQYVHSLQELPTMLSIERGYSESLRIDHKTYLSLQGLARTARHVITEFVRRQEKVATEAYNYSMERAGILRAEMAAEYWIGNPSNVQSEFGRRHLEGFLDQFVSHLQTSSPFTTLEPVLPKIEELLPTLDPHKRLPWLALYTLYNRILPEEHRIETHKDVIRQYQNEFATPAPESLVVHLLLDVPPPWSPADHLTLYQSYFQQRNSARGFRMPGILEIGCGLALTERFRAADDLAGAKAVLADAASNAPLTPELRTALGLVETGPLDWYVILFPSRAANKDAPGGTSAP